MSEQSKIEFDRLDEFKKAYLPERYKHEQLDKLWEQCLKEKIEATAEANKRIEALEGEVAELKEKIYRDALEHDVIREVNNELKANNRDLRESLRYFVDLYGYVSFISDDEKESEDQVIAARKLLAATPAESLANHDDEVIEKCAKAIDEMVAVYTKNCDRYKDIEDKESTERNANKGRAAISCAEVIRALKVEHG